jgi:hypothetical protein
MKKSKAFIELENKITPMELQEILNHSSLYFAYTLLKVSDQLLLKYINYYNLTYKKAFKTIHDLTDEERKKIISLWTTTITPKRDIAKKFLIGPKTINRLFKENGLSQRKASAIDPKWIEYQKLVLRLTQVIIRFYNLPSKPGYEWDHKFSVYAGYKNNVHPNIIASRENLELIPTNENRANGEECSISLNDLLLNFAV